MKILSVIAFLAFSYPAFALFPEPKEGIGSLNFAETDDYRVGDEWGKAPVTQDVLAKATPAFRRAALATARVGGATGFYLGKFNGIHVMATNHHVYPAAWGCLGSTIRFPLLNVAVTCEKFFGSWPEIDLALFGVRVGAADEAKLLAVAANFEFQSDVTPGQKLLTVGFGAAGNPTRNVVAGQDSDCYVFSNEYRKMPDPDRLNPGSYEAWSFANGCDGSHGDSGSAFVDRESGKVVGLIWTGSIPKSAKAQSSANLKRMFESNDRDIWSELTYGVPARKIGEYLRNLLGTNLPPETKATLQAVLE